MKIEFTYTANTLLAYQLFVASKSKRVQKRRAKGKIFLLLIYLALGLFIWQKNGTLTGAVFFLVCMPLYFLYAYMERRQYVNHFRSFIKENFKDRLDRTTALNFREEQIEMTDGQNESVIPLTELESIQEIGTLFSLFMKNGQSLLIPKEAVSSTENLEPFFRQLADRLHIPYQQELDWKWK
jgi:hypothetical protein